MKKLVLAAAAATLLGAGGANAYTIGTFEDGFVVPNVVHNGPGYTTTVGIINKSEWPVGTGLAAEVYWTFFDENSNHKRDGCFIMTYRDFQPFVWANESGVGLENVRGYLVFQIGNHAVSASSLKCYTNTPNVIQIVPPPGPGAAGAGMYHTGPKHALLSANAFQVDLANQDVAYTPVITGPIAYATGTPITSMNRNSVLAVGGAAQVGLNPTIHMRYYVDNAAGGNDTNISVWSTGNHSGTHTVLVADDNQNVVSTNFELKTGEQDLFNVESSLQGRPSAFVDGFIEWRPLQPATGVNPAFGDSLRALVLNGGVSPTFPAGIQPPGFGSAFAYSIISAPAFGAVQSLIAAHQP